VPNTTSTRRPPCPQCRRRRQRLRARSPLANTLCAPVSRWAFTLLAVVALYAGLATPALAAGTVAVLAWRYR
jgi:hypothetical protein